MAPWVRRSAILGGVAVVLAGGVVTNRAVTDGPDEAGASQEQTALALIQAGEAHLRLTTISYDKWRDRNYPPGARETTEWFKAFAAFEAARLSLIALPPPPTTTTAPPPTTTVPPPATTAPPTTTAPPPPDTTRASGVATGYPTYAAYWTAETLNSYFARIAAAGFTKARLDYTAGAGSVADKAVNAARANGLQVMLIILGTISDTPAAYTARVEAAVTQYRDRVSEWQLMNEPNLHGWASGAGYARIVQPSYSAIKTLQPEAVVHLGSIAQYGNGSTTSTDGRYPLNWLRSVYTVGRDFFDEVDVHPYGFYRNLTGQQAFALNQAWAQMVGDGTPSLRQIMVANGDAAKGISVTEYGFPTWLSPWTPTAYPAAPGMDEGPARDATALALADWMKRSYARDIYVYSFLNRAPREGATDIQGYFGLERGDGSRKPAYDVWVNANKGLTP